MDSRSPDDVARLHTTRRFHLPGVFERHDPLSAAAAPVVYDSPHSGRLYPEDFGHAAPLALLRRAEQAQRTRPRPPASAAEPATADLRPEPGRDRSGRAHRRILSALSCRIE